MEMMATRSAFGQALAELATERSDIAVLDADLAGSTKTGEFTKIHPSNHVNVGIAEQDLVATAAGLAISGMKPFACTFAHFLTGRAYDQIRTSVAINDLPVVLVGSHAGILTGEDGATHQSLEDIGLMRGLPNMTVLSPADGVEAIAMTKWAVTATVPVYLRLGRADIPVMYDTDHQFEIGKVHVLRDGKALTVFATGPLVASAATAAAKIADEDGIEVRVVNVSCIQPLDREGILRALSGVDQCITMEDHGIKNGLGSAIAEIIAESGLPVQLTRHGMVRFGESGTSEDLYKKYRFDAEGVMEVIREVLN